MRVLHVQKVAGVAGSERHLLSLLPALVRRGLEVRMCVLSAGDAPRFLAECDRLGIETTVIPAGRDANPTLVGRLLATIRRYRPDLVHTHLVHADAHGQAAALLAGTTAVSSVHGIPWFYGREPYRTLRRTAGRLARRTIAISHHVARCLAEKGLAPTERVRVVHYGIETTGWQLVAPDRAAARVELGMRNEDVVVGVASRLIPHKGHATVLAAMATVTEAEPRVKLLVAGTGPMRPSLEGAAAGLPPGSVRFLGHVPDIRRFMNACDVVVFPTEPGLGEGFGLAALEAMAAARPLVASDIGPLPELVIAERTGLLVPPASPMAMASALLRLARDSSYRARLGEAAAERARQAFSLDRMVDATIATYEEALALGGGGRTEGGVDGARPLCP